MGDCALLFDPGLQAERTELAWQRTALGFFVNSALVARFARDTPTRTAAYVVAAALALTGALALAHAGRLYASRTGKLHAGLPVASPRALQALSLATTLTVLASLALIVLS